MNRRFALSALLALTLFAAPLTSANADSRARASLFCNPTLCVQTTYSNKSLGAWFLDGRDRMLLADDDGFTVVNTFTQKSVFTFDPGSSQIDAIAPSSNRDWVVVALDSGEVYRYNTDNWERVRVNPSRTITNAARVAVDSLGGDVYVARDFGNPTPSTVDHFTRQTFRENFTNPGDDYGIYSLSLDDSDDNLYIGFNGDSPTVYRVDATDLDNTLASDDSDDLWSVSAIDITSDGTVFAANSSEPGVVANSDLVPTVVRMNGTSLATTNSIDFATNWDWVQLSLTDDVETVGVVAGYNNQGDGDSPQSVVFSLWNTSDLTFIAELEFEGTERLRPTTVDIDSSQRYALVGIESTVHLVTLSGEPTATPATYSVMGEGYWVGWEYIYLNPRAKFKWFEVKYTPRGKKKPKVKRVKSSTSTLISWTKPGTSVSVRAVYTNRRYNTSWFTAIGIPG